MAVGAESEVLHSLSCILGTTKQESVRASRGTESKLVQRQNLTTSLLDSSSGSSGKTERGDGELGDSQKAVVIRDRSNNHNSLSLVLFGHVGNEARQRHRRAVDAGHEKSAKHHFVEIGIGTAWQGVTVMPDKCKDDLQIIESSKGLRNHTSQESVQLHQELKVHIVTLGRLAMGAAHMVTIQVDTYKQVISKCHAVHGLDVIGFKDIRSQFVQ